tara:strand:- start:153 stop:749 length:597 start_codon:yes stop_codon:yes gene_type:complete
MPICEIGTGRGYFCQGQVGGIKKVFLANYYDINAIELVTASGTAGTITDVDLKGAAASSLSFFEFDLDRQLSSFNQTIITGSGGALTYQTDLDLHMSHDSQESWAQMQLVCEGVFQVFVLDNNGVYYLAGVSNGLQILSGTFAHGGDVAYADYVGYVVQMNGAEKYPAYNFGTATPFTTYASTDILALSSTTYNDPQA